MAVSHLLAWFWFDIALSEGWATIGDSNYDFLFIQCGFGLAHCRDRGGHTDSDCMRGLERMDWLTMLSWECALCELVWLWWFSRTGTFMNGEKESTIYRWICFRIIIIYCFHWVTWSQAISGVWAHHCGAVNEQPDSYANNRQATKAWDFDVIWYRYHWIPIVTY